MKYTVTNKSKSETVTFDKGDDMSYYMIMNFGDELKICATEVYNIFDKDKNLTKTITIDSYRYVKGIS